MMIRYLEKQNNNIEFVNNTEGNNLHVGANTGVSTLNILSILRLSIVFYLYMTDYGSPYTFIPLFLKLMQSNVFTADSTHDIVSAIMTSHICSTMLDTICSDTGNFTEFNRPSRRCKKQS